MVLSHGPCAQTRRLVMLTSSFLRRAAEQQSSFPFLSPRSAFALKAERQAEHLPKAAREAFRDLWARVMSS